MTESEKTVAYICQGCGGIYWAEVNCDCNTNAAFKMVLVSPIAQPTIKESLTVAPIAQPEQPAEQDATDAQRYRRIRNGPYSDRHGDVYAMTFQGNGDVPIKKEELDRIVDAALAIAQPEQRPLPGMSEMNRAIAYCAAAKLREIGYEWDGKNWIAQPAQTAINPTGGTTP